jgi:tRNA threonylcarbamoyladenosine biosynthesis protein TsaB
MYLAIDTSTRKNIMALEDVGRVVSREFEPRMTQRVIFAELASLLEGKIDRLEGVAVGIGPGSFTGVKIGVMAAKALAWSKGIPLVGIGSLDAVAASTPSPDDPNAMLLVAVPSTRGEAYIQQYRFTGNWCRTGEMRDVSLGSDDLDEWLPRHGLIINGEAAEQLADAIGSRRECAVVDAKYRYPSAEGIFAPARERFAKKETDDPLRLTPDYVRLSQPDRLSGGGAK